jgi:serine/threonine protein kinase
MLGSLSFAEGDELGSGGTATVYSCKIDGRVSDYVVKRFKKTPYASRSWANEVEMLNRFRHEDIIRMVMSEPSPEGHVIVLERGLCDLFTIVTEGRLYRISDLPAEVLPIFLALGYIHERGYVHCDIKLDNIIAMPNGRLKLSDLGLATRLGENGCIIGKHGTPGYYAPEILTEGKSDSKADVFSLGLVLHLMVVGDFPFDWRVGTPLRGRINLDYLLDIPNSAAFADLLSHMLELDPALRYSIEDCLQHPFFNH